MRNSLPACFVLFHVKVKGDTFNEYDPSYMAVRVGLGNQGQMPWFKSTPTLALKRIFFIGGEHLVSLFVCVVLSSGLKRVFLLLVPL